MSTLSKRLLTLPPFSAEKYVKRTIAVSFWKDSNDLIWRSLIYRKYLEYDSLSTKAKTYVDLLMAIECALKSMIISLSIETESPEYAYLTARRCSHNLDKLCEEVRNRAKNRIRFIPRKDQEIITKANTLGVGHRYHIATLMLITQEDWGDRGLLTGEISSVINHEFINSLFAVASSINKLSSQTQDKYLGHYARINTVRWKEIDDRRSLFLKTLGKRF